jgi:outer membrane protein OmpA-like peptidoglycan-associated protein
MKPPAKKRSPMHRLPILPARQPKKREKPPKTEPPPNPPVHRSRRRVYKRNRPGSRPRSSNSSRTKPVSDRLRAQSEQAQQQLRQQLLQQFNLILDTRDTARGLIVNMSDVLFDFNKYTLRPAAREKLAKISGIILSHPGLTLEVDGYTDSVGSEDYNLKLSEHRAGGVRDYLLGEGIAPDNITARGFGKDNPVASNDNAAGRQRNRRVEMVVSGDIIGQPIGPSAKQTN